MNGRKKDQVVMLFDDFDNTWKIKTVPVTLNMAIRFIKAQGWSLNSEKVKIETIQKGVK
jgi:hypothetical protein